MLKIKSITLASYLGIAALGLAMVGIVSLAMAVPITTPADLGPGDLYRLGRLTQ